MLKISVQAMSGAARFSVAVQADSIERALEIVKRQNLGRDSEVTFAIDPEAFLVAEYAATSGPADRGSTAA
jgi:hypothetical protein